MQHYAAFHLGLHCLQTYLFRGFSNTTFFIKQKYSSILYYQYDNVAEYSWGEKICLVMKRRAIYLYFLFSKIGNLPGEKKFLLKYMMILNMF